MWLDSQHLGVMSHASLADAGIPAQQVRSLIASGALRRLRRGHYVESSQPVDAETAHLRLLVAAQREVGDAVISYVSAGLLHGLPVERVQLDRVTMTRSSTGHGNHGQHVVMRSQRLPAHSIVDMDGIPVTSKVRTACDLARTQPFAWGVAACDAALASGVTLADLRTELLAHRRLRGVPRARSVLAFADGRAESPSESLSRVVFARQGVPRPELQFHVVDAHGVVVARCDFGWPEQSVVGEMDGKAKYDALLAPGQTAADAVMAEKRREQAIRDCGFDVVRWTWEDLRNPAALARRVNRALGDGRRLRRSA